MQILGPKANTSTPNSDVVLFQQFLSDPSTTIPINSNFLVSFSRFPNGLKNFDDSEISQWEPNKWSVTDVASRLTEKMAGPPYNYNCLFANGVTLPSETLGTKRIGMAEEFGDFSGGLLSGLVSTSRAQRTPLPITFLETTDSFIDAVLRPWIVAASHYGLYARSNDSPYNVKTDLTVYMFDSRNPSNISNEGVAIRKVFYFQDCVPISFEEQTITYGASEVVVSRTQWVYNYYTIKTGNVSVAQ